MRDKWPVNPIVFDVIFLIFSTHVLVPNVINYPFKDWISSKIYIYKFGSYLTGNTLSLRCKDQPVNDVCENKGCLLWEPY
jgi:hypothetical protein